MAEGHRQLNLTGAVFGRIRANGLLELLHILLESAQLLHIPSVLSRLPLVLFHGFNPPLHRFQLILRSLQFLLRGLKLET